MTARKVPIIATLVVAAAVATMIWLGFWQLDRMAQKEALLARYAQAQGNTVALTALPADPLNNLYRRTPFTCSTVAGWNAIAGRNADDDSGYIHIAQCPGAEVVIGWSQGPTQPEWAGGAITGTIAPGGAAGWRIVADPPLAGLQANAVPDPASIPNNHFAYAVQWFLFAITALVIYILALRRRAR